MNPATVIVSLLIALIDHLQQISQLITAAGGGPLTADQWTQIVASDDQARAALSAAIAALKPPAPTPSPSPPPPPTTAS